MRPTPGGNDWSASTARAPEPYRPTRRTNETSVIRRGANDMLKSGASRFVGLTLVALTYASAATADPVVITGGSISMANGVDLPGFTLTAPDSSFTGILPTSGVTCCVFAPGDVVQ